MKDLPVVLQFNQYSRQTCIAVVGLKPVEKGCVFCFQYVQLVTKTTEDMFQHSQGLGHHKDRIKPNLIRKSLLFCVSSFWCALLQLCIQKCWCQLIWSYFIFQRQPSYLLPFFCLQVFDFCVNLLGAVGAISYIPELKLMLKNNVSFMNVKSQF